MTLVSMHVMMMDMI